MKWLQILKRLDNKGCFLFTVDEFKMVIGSTQAAAKQMLKRYANMGLVARLKRGLYVILAKKPPDIFIANRLYEPSYVSLEFALSYYHIIPEAVYTITSVTVKPTREFHALGKAFSYSTVRKKGYTGYEPKKIDNYTVLIASPEKALADYLYFVSLKRKVWNDRFDVGSINKKKFLKFAAMFKNRKLTELARSLT